MALPFFFISSVIINSKINLPLQICESCKKDNLDSVRQLKCWSGQFYFSLIRLVFINRPLFNLRRDIEPIFVLIISPARSITLFDRSIMAVSLVAITP